MKREELVARVKARSVPRKVRDTARLADPRCPEYAGVELDDEDVVAREHWPVRRGRRRLSRILHLRLHVRGAVVRAMGESYGRRRLVARAERWRFRRPTVCSGWVSVRTGTRPP